MKQQSLALLALTLVAALFASCAPHLGSVAIDLASFPDNRSSVALALRLVDLPTGFSWAEDDVPVDFEITYSAGFESAAAAAIATGLADSVTLHTSFYAPVLPYWSARMSVAASELGARAELPSPPARTATITPAPLVKLSEVKLPWKAVAIDGLYPDNPQYRGVYVEKLLVASAARQAGAAGSADAADSSGSEDKSDAANSSGAPDNSDTAKAQSPEPTPSAKLTAWLAEAVQTIAQTGDLKLGVAPVPRVFRLGGVGDIMPGRGVDTTLLGGASGLTTIFGDVLPILQRQDYLIGNFESTVTRLGQPWAKSYTFRVSPAVLPKLREAGFDYFSLANNHAYDFGEVAFADSIKNLREAGFHTSGVGRNIAEAREPFDIAFADYNLDLRILSLGAFPIEANRFQGLRDAAATETRAGMLWATDDNLAHLAKLFAPAEKFSIVVVHAGYEWVHTPDAGMKKFHRDLVDRGADLVLAHHPHVLQGIEVYKGAVIAYSLGNFIFAGMDGTNGGEDTMVLSLGLLDGRVVYLDFHPVQMSGRSIATGGELIANRVESLSRALYGSP